MIVRVFYFYLLFPLATTIKGRLLPILIRRIKVSYASFPLLSIFTHLHFKIYFPFAY